MIGLDICFHLTAKKIFYKRFFEHGLSNSSVIKGCSRNPKKHLTQIPGPPKGFMTLEMWFLMQNKILTLFEKLKTLNRGAYLFILVDGGASRQVAPVSERINLYRFRNDSSTITASNNIYIQAAPFLWRLRFLRGKAGAMRETLLNLSIAAMRPLWLKKRSAS